MASPREKFPGILGALRFSSGPAMRLMVGLAVTLVATAASAEQTTGSAESGVAEAAQPAQPAPPKVVPPTLTTPSPAPYPESLQEEGVTGKVKLDLIIDAAGRVEDAIVTEGAHPLLDAAAIEAARKLGFTPATADGIPTPVRIQYVYEFTVPLKTEAEKAEAGRTAVLTGQVRAMATRRPIAMAALVLDDGRPAVETDAQGRFRVKVKPGSLKVTVSAAGHKPGVFREIVKEHQTLEVIYAIEPDQLNPYETVVHGERERTEVTRITLREQELREVPGTMGDPFRVVMLMPGVASMASGISYPVVRGSQPASTGYFIDGVRVPALYHLMLGPAVIHPDFIESVDFYPGMTPARYGRLLGGAVEGHISRPREDRLHATAYADFINAGVFTEYPFKETGTSVTLAGRVSYTGWLAGIAGKALTDGEVTPVADFYDYQARVEQKLGQGRLRLFAFGSSDVVGANAREGSGDISGRTYTIFHRIDLRSLQPLAGGEFEAGVTYGQEKLGVAGEREVGPPVGEESLGDFGLRQQSMAGRLGYKRALGSRVQLELGADVEHRRGHNNITAGASRAPAAAAGHTSALQVRDAIATFAGAYTQLSWKVTDRWLVTPGFRADHWYLEPGVRHTTFDPRLSVRHRLTDKLVLKAGAGMVHQPPTVLISLPAMDVAGLRYGLQEATQLDVGAEWAVTDGLEVNADVYYNPIARAVEFDINEVLSDTRRRGIPPEAMGGEGRAYGFELMVRHPLGRNWFGWVSYSFSRAQRFVPFSRFDDQNGVLSSERGWVDFAFEQQHVVNAAVSYKFGRNWTLGTVVHYNTGRPETGEVSSRSRRPSVDAETGEPMWVFDDRDRVKRLPSFFRVDVRASKSWAFQSFALDAYLDILNISLQKEVLGYDYLSRDEFGSPGLRQSPLRIPVVVPMLGLKGTY